jgi:futalosine hydrolase
MVEVKNHYLLRILYMPLLICAATEFEILPTISFLKEKKINNAEVLITGIGLMESTYRITKAVLSKRPDFIIQAGIAGCLDEALPLTSIVLVKSEMIGDLGVLESGIFKSVFDMKLADKNTEPYKNGLLTNNLGPLEQSGLTIVNGVTVNEITTDKQRICTYKKAGAQVESMEGAAIHYVGLMEHIPFLQIRSLSNFAGERDKSKWVIKEAIWHLNLELEKLFSKFLKI